MKTITIGEREYTPADAIAERVTRPGKSYAPAKVDGPIWDARPATMRLPAAMINKIDQRIPGMQIVGLYRVRSKSGGRRGQLHIAVWLVRCDCGKYCTRTNITWNKMRKQGGIARCQYCAANKAKVNKPRTKGG